MEVGKIRLRPLRYEDKADLTNLADNKKIWMTLRDMFPHPYTLQDAEKFIDMAKAREIPSNFAVEYDHSFAGVISLILQEDIYLNSAEVGYWIGEPFWNKGIATAALGLITQYGFEKLGLRRIYASVFEGNAGSKRVLEKNGYIREGIFRKAVFKNHQYFDEWRYAKLKGE
jgi:[ribosomal protein S5]-alanine N-acetyltransferase